MTEPNPNDPRRDAIDELRRLVDASDTLTATSDTRYWGDNGGQFNVDSGDPSRPWSVSLSGNAGDSIDD